MHVVVLHVCRVPEQASAYPPKSVSQAGSLSLSGLPWELAIVCLGVAAVEGGMQVCSRALQVCVKGSKEGVRGVYAPDLCVTELVMQECRAGRSVPEGVGQVEVSQRDTGSRVGLSMQWDVCGREHRCLGTSRDCGDPWLAKRCVPEASFYSLIQHIYTEHLAQTRLRGCGLASHLCGMPTKCTKWRNGLGFRSNPLR